MPASAGLSPAQQKAEKERLLRYEQNKKAGLLEKCKRKQCGLWFRPKIGKSITFSPNARNLDGYCSAQCRDRDEQAAKRAQQNNKQA